MAYNKLSMHEKIAIKASWIGGCLIWHGATTKSGYGTVRIGGKRKRAHRIVYELLVGPIPPGAVVMHSCDNPACINIAHLSLGTQADNIRDMKAKGRDSPRTGENNTRAVLTADQVAEARRRFIPYDRKNGTRALAREFCVSGATISAAIRGKTWKP